MKKSYTILVAEDEVNNYTLLEYIFRKEGHEVIWARNGEEAVDIVLNKESTNIDLVLMDIKMPVMNGYEATRKIKEASLDIPVMAVTANVFADDRDKCMEAGCDEYISKPIKRANLLSIAYKLIEENED